MKLTRHLLLLGALCALTALSCAKKTDAPASPFVTVEDGHFVRNGQPYTFIGTNFWYGPILASEGRGGDYDRLCRELDTLKALGIENLRVLAGADGADGVFSRVEPTLQTAPGVYNDTLLVGLDRFLVELGKRDMQAVLYVNNSWEWSGGYGQYLEWATGEKALIPLIDGYWPFMQQMRKFQTSEPSQQLYFNHLRTLVGRTNSLTGKPYSEDPAIFAWQIGNEPRCFSGGGDLDAGTQQAIQDGFIAWMTEAAKIVKELDPNHLLCLQVDTAGRRRPDRAYARKHLTRRAEALVDGPSRRELPLHFSEGKAEHRRVPRSHLSEGAPAARAEISLQRLPV